MSKEEQLKLNLDKAYQLIQRAYSALNNIMEKDFYRIMEGDDEDIFADDKFNNDAYQAVESGIDSCKRELEEFEMLNGHEIEELLK